MKTKFTLLLFCLILSVIPSLRIYGQSTKSQNSIYNDHEFVDLGLSVMWATCNVGASSPSNFGHYFAWGETTIKEQYTITNVKYCNPKSWEQFSKYVTDSHNGTVDNKKVLEPSDDAATKNWGGKWRMPTDEEWTELRENCTWTWTNMGGHDGCKATSKINGKSIFFPAAGMQHDNIRKAVGEVGYYWTSSLAENDPRLAWYVSIFSTTQVRSHEHRYRGHSVRPVFRP